MLLHLGRFDAFHNDIDSFVSHNLPRLALSYLCILYRSSGYYVRPPSVFLFLTSSLFYFLESSSSVRTVDLMDPFIERDRVRTFSLYFSRPNQ